MAEGDGAFEDVFVLLFVRDSCRRIDTRAEGTALSRELSCKQCPSLRAKVLIAAPVLRKEGRFMYLIDMQDQDRESESIRYLLESPLHKEYLLSQLGLGSLCWIVMEVDNIHLVPSVI